MWSVKDGGGGTLDSLPQKQFRNRGESSGDVKRKDSQTGSITTRKLKCSFGFLEIGKDFLVTNLANEAGGSSLTNVTKSSTAATTASTKDDYYYFLSSSGYFEDYSDDETNVGSTIGKASILATLSVNDSENWKIDSVGEVIKASSLPDVVDRSHY